MGSSSRSASPDLRPGGRGLRDRALVVGRVLRPHGVHGEVKVRPETDFPERFARLREVLVRRDDRTEVRTVEGVRWQGAVALVKLAGVEDPEAARRTTSTG